MTVLNDSIRKSKKERKCEECWKTIVAGESYHSYVGTGDDGFFWNAACLHCSAARRIVGNSEGDDYFETYYGGLSEYLIENWAYAGAAFGRLLVGVNSHWTYRSGRPMPIPVTAREDRP